MKKLVLGFPGQGSQKIGMGKQLISEFPIAKEFFEKVNSKTGNLFTEIVWNNDKSEELNKTYNAQPAVLAVSIAVLECLKEIAKFEPTPQNTSCLIGHSLGEYSCLVAAKSLDLFDALKLVKRRGEVMQEVATAWGKKPAMAAVLGLSWIHAKEIEKMCPPGLFVEAANANGPEQTVISGCDEGVSWGVEQAKKVYGAKRGIKLAVSCPFHTSLLKSAAESFLPDLEKVNIVKPAIPIVFNYDVSIRSKPAEIREVLFRGIYSTVRWSDCVIEASKLSKASQFREIGGDTLKFGFKNVPNLELGTPIRPMAEDIKNFYL